MRLTCLLIFIAFVTSCGTVRDKTTVVPSPIPEPSSASVIEEKVIPDSPQSRRTFHEYITEVATMVGMRNLRVSPLAEKDFGLRIWGGFGLTRLQGFILRRKGSEWSSHKIGYAEDGKPRPPVLIAVAEPTSGWQPTWESMLRHKTSHVAGCPSHQM